MLHARTIRLRICYSRQTELYSKRLRLVSGNRIGKENNIRADFSRQMLKVQFGYIIIRFVRLRERVNKFMDT